MSDTERTDAESRQGGVSKPLLRLKLLDALRQGDFDNLRRLLQAGDFQPLEDADIQEVVQLLLHYAVQVAPFGLIREIVSQWCGDSEGAAEGGALRLDVNKQDSDGNTPLHLAALQSRADVVQLLMNHAAINDCIVNRAHLQPIEVCKNLNIAQMMQINRANYVAEVAHEFRLAFNNRDFSHLEAILSNARNAELLDINGTDPETGDTVLHEFVKKRDIVMCRWIIDHGGDPFKRDKRGKLPINSLSQPAADADGVSEAGKTAADAEIKQLLEKAAREQSVIDVTNKLHEPPSYKGYLRKWTNFAQGYKLRWFILSTDGTLSYYKDQDDTANACRGSLNMSTCYLHLDSSEKLKFEIIGGSDGAIRWHLKGNHPIETNKWVWAIQSAIRTAKDREIMLRNPNHAPTHEQPQSPLPQVQQQVMHSSTSIPVANMRIGASTTTLPSIGYKMSTVSMKSGSEQRRNPNLLDTRLVKTYSNTSVSSSDVELNDNLTDSGRQYVAKVKSKLPSRSVSGSSSQTHSTTESSHVSHKIASNKISQDESLPHGGSAGHSLILRPFEEYEEEDEVEDSMTHAKSSVVYNDEEDVKVNYGPYAQELSMLQRSIIIEISTLNELLEDGSTTEDVLEAARKSLITINKSFAQLNRLTERRDQRLVKMLAKQRDINNLWIKSVKELEMELVEKSEKLANMDRDRRDIKKLLQRKMHEASALPESASLADGTSIPELLPKDSTRQFAEIVELIQSNQSSDAEDSETDEFFDAEDAVKDEQTLSTPLESPVQHDELGDESPAKVVESAPVAKEEQRTEIVIIAPTTLESGESEVRGNNTESDVMTLGKTHVPVIPEISEDDVPALESTQSIAPTAATSDGFAVNQLQMAKENVIVGEGTFLGYEDGVRKKLALDKDERPKINLWSVLKSMIGKDMTHMSLPVTFNEPTSILQRVGEDLEYSDLLDNACSFSDSTLRLLYISAFVSSSYASTINRVAKPFNPLLGETFEYARPDKHYRFFTEQVSHHPPISATWTESPKWDFFGESHVDTKFYGRSFDVKHLGLYYITLRPDDGSGEEIYTFNKPNNSVIGILIGKPELDNHGEVTVTNHSTGDYTTLHFKPRGWRSANAFEVRGEVFDCNGVKKWVLGGHWNEALYAKSVQKHNASDELTLDRSKAPTTRRSSVSGGPYHDGRKFLLWHANERPVSPFNLTSFAITLNADRPSLMPWVAITDTRRRPDQRAMENGEYDKAAEEKQRVEEKQRAARKLRETNGVPYAPAWFTREVHPVTGQQYWKYNGLYWKMRKERNLPVSQDIF
ncbi:AER225Wp [Eremothecium gossypii ATCC 10895]|uniref:AER225Wp n=1 Tax=Eremothecium gossypii (strain ATCC 10895 / CBS 109.51 / FGSC 9923 / NRRL Y-1056) TaxID=284811 RepID=Q756M9_EREGS|nr:AER225Wp [Eremothecium gossypii ATCC 10895]AAS52906.2 AER225Wp [Eremothecium gossypii ATCC 10895]AEY97214.1 FAER225Wp [Eremothecium gossypii FDAG1]